MYNLHDVRLVGCDYLSIRQMFVMRKTWQVGKMRCAIIAESQTGLFVLAVIAIIEMHQFTISYHHSFMNFQQMPILGA